MQDNQLSAFAGLPNLPAIKELQSFKSWVSWEYRAKSESEKPSKVPISPKTGFAASSTNSETWGDYQGALQIATRRRLPGVGFVLSDHDEFTGIDLDDCINDEGDPEPWAQEILDLAETYCETTPSGHGLRLIARGKVERSVKQNSAGVEIYRDKRYLTITGDHWPGSPVDIRPAPKTLELLMRRVEQARAVASVAVTAPTPSSSTSDRALDEIKDLLSHIPPDCGYDEWLNVLMALHFETNGTGIDIADQWSSGGSKYKGRREIEAKWRSFKSGGITGGTLAEIARRYGANLSKIAIEHLLPPCNSDDLQQMSKNADNMLASALKRRGIRNVVTAPDGTVADAETGEIIGAGGEGAGTEATRFDQIAIGRGVDWTQPGGLIEDIATWIMSISRWPNRPLAVAAAVSIVSALCGRHLYSPEGSSLNVYVIGLAGTGVGKGSAISAPATVLSAAGLAQLHTTLKSFSVSGFEDMITDHPCCVATSDEIGPNLFRKMAHRNSSTHEQAMRGPILELWSRFIGMPPFETTRRAKAQPVKIPSPALTIFGVSTPKEFYNAVTSGSVSDGFLNRFLIATGAPRGRKNSNVDPDMRKVPASIVDRLKAIVPPGIGNLASGAGVFSLHAHVDEVQMTWADDGVTQAADRFEDEIAAAMDAEPQDAPLMARAFEYSVRLASLHAVSRGGRHEPVRMEDLAWGAAWAMQSAVDMIGGVKTLMAQNDYEAKFNAVRAVIEDAGIISGRELLRSIRHISARERDDILRHIEGAEMAQRLEEKTKGRSRISWKWIG